MEIPNHLLVVVDPTATRHPAVERARSLALAFGARVELFVCYQPHLRCDLRIDERALERLANGLREQGIETTTSESSSPAIHLGVLDKVMQCRPSMVLKDAHPHSLLRRTVLPNTDWQLIRTCTAPLLFVRDSAGAQVRKVAAAVDVAAPREKPASLDRALLSAAETMALALRAELYAVHAWLPVVPPVTLAVSNGARALVDSERNADVEQARARLDELISGHAVAPENRQLLQGAPEEVLVPWVREREIDLLVVGTYSRGWVYNVVVGSTTERILEYLPCDVLVIRPAQR